MGGATDKRLFYIPTYMVKQVNLAPMQEESPFLTSLSLHSAPGLGCENKGDSCYALNPTNDSAFDLR